MLSSNLNEVSLFLLSCSAPSLTQRYFLIRDGHIWHHTTRGFPSQASPGSHFFLVLCHHCWWLSKTENRTRQSLSLSQMCLFFKSQNAACSLTHH